MSLRVIRTAAALLTCAFVLLLCSPACVVRLSDRNAPLDNGGVTGPSLDCNTVTPLSAGGPGTGAAKTKFVGRFDLTDPTKPHFDWSGNYMTARFDGTDVTWGAESGVEVVFEQIIDDKAEQIILGGLAPRLVNVKVPAGTHEIKVVRSSEALFGDVEFTPFTFGAGTKQLPATERPRRIEYIGDSITCGYGDEGPNATCPYDVPIRTAKDDQGHDVEVKIAETQNINIAYGSLVAQRLSADAVTLCFSGKGVVVNYREQGVGEGAIINPNDKPDPDARTTIPQYYLRTLASNPKSPPWDFTKELPSEKPQVVVINIGTNDFARDADQNSIADGIDLPGFRAGYLAFVKFVRSKRPDAEMFLAVPPMVTDKFPLDNARSDFRNTLRSIVEELNGSGDPKVYFIELVEMGVRYGLGCDYHPNRRVHEIMADQVAGAIHTKTCW